MMATCSRLLRAAGTQRCSNNDDANARSESTMSFDSEPQRDRLRCAEGQTDTVGLGSTGAVTMQRQVAAAAVTT